MIKNFSSQLATLASIAFMSLLLTLGACNKSNDDSSEDPKVNLGVQFSSLFKSQAAQGSLGFTVDQIMTGQMQVTNTSTSAVQTFNWTIYLDEDTWATQSNKTIILDPGNYEFSLLVTKGSHQYAGTAVQAIVDGQNTVAMTVSPIIGDTLTNVSVVARLADFKFQYSASELGTAGFANPQMGIIVDGGAEQIFAINPATGISDNYVNLPDGVHNIKLKLYDGAAQRGRSVVAQESQTIVFGNNIAMDLVALHGETMFTLTEDGGDAVFNFSVPAEVIDEAGGVGNLQTVFKFSSSKNPSFDDVSLALTPDGSGDYTGTHTHNVVQYDDPVALTLEFTDTSVSPDELLGSCVIADAVLNNAPQSKICELTLRRRAIVGGSLLATLGVNVKNTAGEPMPGISIYANDTLLGLTNSGSFGTEGYLKTYLETNAYTIRAESNDYCGQANVTLDALGVDNLEITVDICPHLDSSFNSHGYVTHDGSGGNQDMGNAIATDANGKILVTGYMKGGSGLAVWRYNPDGSLDTTFNGQGYVTHATACSVILGGRGHSIVADSNNRVLITGICTNNGGYSEMVIWRYNSNGSLDTTFNGQGYTNHLYINGNANGEAITIDSSGRIVVAGHGHNSDRSNNDLVIWRYNSNGSLDTSFNGQGYVAHDNAAGGNSNEYGLSSTIDSNGKILVTGYSANSAGNYEMAIWRYNSNGSLDASFNGQGYVTSEISGGGSGSFGYKIILDSNNKILVSGNITDISDKYDMAVWRYNPDGSLDVSFNGQGYLTYNNPERNDHDTGLGIAIDSSGRILVAGTSYDTNGRDLVVRRYNNNGSLDASFNERGYALHSINSNDTVHDMVLDAAGKILVTGYTGINGNDMVIWRLLND